MFVVAHKVLWFSVLTMFCDIINCCCSQDVMVKCLLLLIKFDGLVF